MNGIDDTSGGIHAIEVAPCYVALLTAPGRGAVATVAVAGARSAVLLQQCFRSASEIEVARFKTDLIYFGHWHGGDGGSGVSAAASAAATDEEVVVRRVGETEFEIHCHGGWAASERMIASLEALDAVKLPPEDWIRIVKPEALDGAAIEALAKARTTRTAGILLDQYRGAMKAALTEIIEELRTARERAVERLERLNQLAKLGSHLTTPWRIVVAGTPNVGKSSLVNALVGFDRCIVLDEPGTTRDVVSVTTALDGWPVEIHDTAGLRASGDQIEAQGVDLARAALTDADLILLVMDASARSWTSELRAIDGRANTLTVWNKTDLLPVADFEAANRIAVSALSGAGIDRLVSESLRQLIPVVPRTGEAVPFTAELATSIAEALASASQGDLAAAERHLAYHS